jgi:hypothetical protein
MASSSTSTPPPLFPKIDQPSACGPPPPEVTYLSPEACFTAIQVHAAAHGYCFKKQGGKANKKLYFCDRSGEYDSKGKHPETSQSRQRPNTSTKKCGCKMRVELRLFAGAWKLSVIEGTHNHGSSAAPSAHPAHRKASSTPEIRAAVIKYSSLGMGSNQILLALRTDFPSNLLNTKDISNILHQARLLQLDGQSPVEWLLNVYDPSLNSVL